MNGYIFERCLVSYVSNLAEERFNSHSEFGKAVFPGAEAPANTWRYVRNGNQGKVRRIDLEEAFNMAFVLGMDLDTLCWKVRRELEEGWSLEKDVCQAPALKAGRPKKTVEEH